MNEPVVFPPTAFWIGSAHPFDLHEAYLCFRSPRGWCLNHLPAQAHLFITADSRYRLWVNGHFVARGPARCWPHAQSVDQLDLTPYLQIGPNVLAVQVYQPGYSHFAYVHRGAAGFLAHLVCDGQTTLVTDTAWRTCRDPSYHDGVPRLSIYQAGVEDRDLRLAAEWMWPGYDDTAWPAARIVATVGDAPWTGLERRTLPLLHESDLPLMVVTTRGGQVAGPPGTDPHSDLRRDWAQAHPQPWPADEAGWWLPSLAAQETAFWVFDLGRGYTCQGWAEVEGASGEERVLISYSEKFQGPEPYLSDPTTYCRVRMTDRFRLRPGKQIVEGFSPRGGRVLIFQVIGPTGPGFRIRFRVRGIEYPLVVKRRPAHADPLLQAILNLCENTLRACLHDGWVDNPWRENAQWIGDALTAGPALAVISDDYRPLRRVIEMAAQGAYPDGVLPSVLPSEAHAYVVLDFNFQWVELLATYRRLSGDEAFVTAMWPTLVKMIERFACDSGPDGLIRSQPGRRLFLDWAPVSKAEPNAIYNLHFLLALQIAARMATARHAPTDAARWTHLAAGLQAAIRTAFWDGHRWWDDPDRTTCSQLATALALLTGCNHADEEPALLDALAARSLDPSDESPLPGARPADPQRMVLASPYMHHRVFAALCRGGRWDVVEEIIRLRWGRWVQAGYPTTWENWNVDFPDGSQCHAFSAHPLYHLLFSESHRGEGQ
jgi:alpha-L-rhamnosidase